VFLSGPSDADPETEKRLKKSKKTASSEKKAAGCAGFKGC
jgi:hypothetical protein